MNMALGTGNLQDTIHIIDFGLAKKYVDERTGKHIPSKKNKIPLGAPRYRSINMMKGLEIGRADDCESVMYMLTEFATDNELPWAQSGKIDFANILRSKETETLSVACRGLPSQFELLNRYVRTVSFYERPDYGQIIEILRGLYM